MRFEKNLERLGITLPLAPTPMGNYLSVRRSGNLLFFSGTGPFENGKPVVFGKVGGALTLEQGREAARLAGVNLIAQLKQEVGELDQVKQFVKVLAFVSSAPDFVQKPAVMNGASDLFAEAGKHVRSAVSMCVSSSAEIQTLTETIIGYWIPYCCQSQKPIQGCSLPWEQ